MWGRECGVDPLMLLYVTQEVSNLPLEVIEAVDMDFSDLGENWEVGEQPENLNCMSALVN